MYNVPIESNITNNYNIMGVLFLKKILECKYLAKFLDIAYKREVLEIICSKIIISH